MLTPQVKRSPENAENDREAVIAQLEKILEYPAFRSSVRSARFLRYIVEQWLNAEHHGEPLKERTLGVALFGLDPAYDTTQNTVVRNAAVDVRKRLVLYYLEPSHAGELQITLPPGSYVPQIHFPEQKVHLIETQPASVPAEQEEKGDVSSDAAPPAAAAISRQFSRRNLVFLGLIVLAAVGLGMLGGALMQRRSPSQSSDSMGKTDLASLNPFWGPVLNATPLQSIILISVGQLAQPVDNQQVTPVGNVFATTDIARLLAAEGIKFRIDVANAFTAEELQSSTVILIGGADNPWTSFSTEDLRFHIASQNDPGSKGMVWIEDRKNPGSKEWSFTSPSQYSGEVADYAILARFKDPRSGQWRVLASGLDGVGTSTASRVLVMGSSMREIARQLPAGWASKNIEVVLKVKIFNGKVGYPQLVAYEVW